jgi:hypothetical protein
VVAFELGGTLSKVLLSVCGTLSKVLLSVCVMSRKADTCFGFCFSRRHMGKEGGTVQLVQ